MLNEQGNKNTGPVCRMSHRKGRETKQPPSNAMSDYQRSCCLFFLHFLCDILHKGPVLGTKNFLMEQLHLSLNELFLLALLWRTETLRGAVMSAFNFVCKTSYPNGKEETWIHQLGLVSHNTSHLFCFFLAWSACPASLNLPLAASFYHCCLILTFSLSLKSDVNCQGCKIGHEFSQLLNHTYSIV